MSNDRTPEQMHHLLKRLFPIGRSLTGDGNRETLKILSEWVNLDILEVPSGTQVFDWTVPAEWSVQSAELWEVVGASSRKVADYSECNLRLVNYSRPFEGVLTYNELLPHLHTLPEQPDAIPYKTTYYKDQWGFCLTHNELAALNQDATFRVAIRTTLNAQGSLSMATALKKGALDQEVLISTYCCHPSLANDNLSGLVVATFLFHWLSKKETRYSYRLVIVPESIGAITFLATRSSDIKKVIGGAVITTAGGPGPLGLKRSFKNSSIFDQAAESALNTLSSNWINYEFVPDGSDERQYASPGFRIPTITISKSKYYEYPEYHTSLDNLDFVTSEGLYAGLEAYQKWVEALEINVVYERIEIHCEFQLEKYGLYPHSGNPIYQELKNRYTSAQILCAIEWLMFGVDGINSLLKISNFSKVSIELLSETAKLFLNRGLFRIKV